MYNHSSCFIPFTLFGIVSLFMFSHPTEYLVIAFVSFIFNTLIIIEVEELFFILIDHLYIL